MSLTACSGGSSTTNPAIDPAVQASLQPVSSTAIGSSAHRHSPLTLPAGCSNQYSGYIYCNVAVGTSLALPTPITIATGFNPCGPTATLSTALYAGTSDPNITMSIAPATESVSCGQTITRTVTFTVSSTATPGQGGIQAHVQWRSAVADRDERRYHAKRNDAKRSPSDGPQGHLSTDERRRRRDGSTDAQSAI